MLNSFTCLWLATSIHLGVHGHPVSRHPGRTGQLWWNETHIWDNPELPTTQSDSSDLPDFTFRPFDPLSTYASAITIVPISSMISTFLASLPTDISTVPITDTSATLTGTPIVTTSVTIITDTTTTVPGSIVRTDTTTTMPGSTITIASSLTVTVDPVFTARTTTTSGPILTSSPTTTNIATPAISSTLTISPPLTSTAALTSSIDVTSSVILTSSIVTTNSLILPSSSGITTLTSRFTTTTSSAIETTHSTTASSILLTTTPTITATSTSSIIASSSTTSSSATSMQSLTSNGFINAAYFINWGTYARDYYPNQLPVDQLTHVFYAFAVQQANGTVTSSDPAKDAICVEQLRVIKQNNPSLKVILSIGGWTASQDGSFSELASTGASRYIFASSAVALMQSYGFDGIDIDWEYPENEADAANLVLLLQEVRSALTILGNQYNQHHFLLTVACPAGPDHYNLWHLADMVQYLDFFNFMGYDYMGAGFSTTSGHQANLYKSSTNPSSTDFETESAIDDYIAAGVNPATIILGMPAYGRSFDNTELGGPFTMPTTGSWVDSDTGEGIGIWDYKSLPKAGATEIYAVDAGATYSYDSDTGELISYDTASMVSRKLNYVLSMGLGGAYFWEASADRTDDASLISTSATKLRAAGALDSTANYVY